MKEEIDKIRLLIAEGASEEAIDRLLDRPEEVGAFYDELVLLHNRLAHLDKSVLEGTIAREDENIERNTITRSLLNLIKRLENRSLQENNLPPPSLEAVRGIAELQDEPETQIAKTRKWPGRRLRRLALFTLAPLALLLAWGIGTWVIPPTGKDATPILPEFTARLVFQPENPNIKQTGTAKLVVGEWASEPMPIPSDGVILFRNIPEPSPDNSVRLELSDVKYACRVVGENAASQGTGPEMTFIVELDMQTFSGRIIHQDFSPAKGVEIDIENGLAHAVTDGNGKYTVTLPKLNANTVRLILSRKGKVLIDRKIGLDPEVFRELKILD
jgi:hypothetical protein